MTYATVNSYSPFKAGEIVKIIRRAIVADCSICVCQRPGDERYDVLIPIDNIEGTGPDFDVVLSRFKAKDTVFFSSTMNPDIKGGTKVIIDTIHYIENRDNGTIDIKCGIHDPVTRVYDFVDESDLMGLDEVKGKKTILLSSIKVVTDDNGVQLVVIEE